MGVLHAVAVAVGSIIMARLPGTLEFLEGVRHLREQAGGCSSTWGVQQGPPAVALLLVACCDTCLFTGSIKL
jgi:hypothetical protein